MTSIPKAIIVDVDGTVALMGDRSPYDDHLAWADKPNVPVVKTVQALLYEGCETRLIVMSGRDEGRSRDVTFQWLWRHRLVPDLLLMRPAGDVRKDAIVKRELFDTHVAGKYDVLCVFDDRQQVVDMWRNDLGLTCFQVAPGNF